MGLPWRLLPSFVGLPGAPSGIWLDTSLGTRKLQFWQYSSSTASGTAGRRMCSFSGLMVLLRRFFGK